MKRDFSWALDSNPKYAQLRALRDPDVDVALDELRSFLGDLPERPPPPFHIPRHHHCQVCDRLYSFSAARTVEVNLEVARRHAFAAAIFCTSCGQPVWAYDLPTDYVWRDDDASCAAIGIPHTHTIIWSRGVIEVDG